MRLLESLGLGLLLASVAVGLLTLWLHSTSGQALAQRFPRFAALMQARALVLLLMLAGISLLVLGIFMNPSATPPGPSQVLIDPAPLKMTDLPAKPLPTPVPTPAPAPTPTPAATPAVQAPAPESNSHPLPRPEAPVKPMQTVRPTPRPASAVQARPAAPEVAPQKKNIFSARCARLLEKVGAGEPMTPQEQHEMVSKCQ